jgi:hypothetical protein
VSWSILHEELFFFFEKHYGSFEFLVKHMYTEPINVMVKLSLVLNEVSRH